MDLSTLLPLFLQAQGGGNNDLMKMLPNLLGQNNSQAQAKPQENVKQQEKPQPQYDTNPQYLQRFASREEKPEQQHTQEAQNDSAHTTYSSPEEEFAALKNAYYGNGQKASTQSANTTGNSGTQGSGNMGGLGGMLNNPMLGSLLSMMGGGGGGGDNPLSSIMSMMGNKKPQEKKKASVLHSGNLTKPIELFAPSTIILNIRKLLA